MKPRRNREGICASDNMVLFMSKRRIQCLIPILAFKVYWIALYLDEMILASYVYRASEMLA